MKHSDSILRNAIIEHLPKLQRFALALTGSRMTADDLLQSTVERLLLKGAPQGSGFVWWMYRVCRNAWIDEIRSNSKQVLPGSDEIEQRIGSDDGEQQAIDRITLDEINQVMQQLEDSQRMVLVLVTVEGYSYKEVAHIMEIPIGTVMSRLARARKKMADLLITDQHQ